MPAPCGLVHGNKRLAVATTNPSSVERWRVSWLDTPELLTAREPETMLKISAKTIYGNAQRGLIPYVKIQSKCPFPETRNLNLDPRSESSTKGNRRERLGTALIRRKLAESGGQFNKTLSRAPL